MPNTFCFLCVKVRIPVSHRFPTPLLLLVRQHKVAMSDRTVYQPALFCFLCMKFCIPVSRRFPTPLLLLVRQHKVAMSDRKAYQPALFCFSCMKFCIPVSRRFPTPLLLLVRQHKVAMSDRISLSTPTLYSNRCIQQVYIRTTDFFICIGNQTCVFCFWQNMNSTDIISLIHSLMMY